ncbi:MAG: NAD-dependent epimerase/dehydratase family protein, partial [Muribaculaceae bacterium]|nr:NAD-dependent epimerase/dehydratase family protein [Muribaculaceae bacterium]
MKILVTGAAGFIGSQLMEQLARRGDEVVGLDNINDYYDVRLKYGRLRRAGFEFDGNEAEFGKEVTSTVFPNCRFVRLSIDDKKSIDRLFAAERFDKVVNLAAQAGVRYSITNPYAYLESNLIGFLNILEACRNFDVKYLVYASSSSVYGLNTETPYKESDKVDTPVSLYAATKKSNELMAHAYSKLYGMKVTGLRYFTVYGPWGRPDMSPMLFAKAITAGEPIKVFNNGDMIRDFTYIDDIVEGTMQVVDNEPVAENLPNGVAARVYNIGCSNPVKLMDFISEIENAMGVTANKNYLPMQPGDVYQTNADTTALETEIGYKP